MTVKLINPDTGKTEIALRAKSEKLIRLYCIYHGMFTWKKEKTSIKKYYDLTEKWMNQVEVFSILCN
jgi:hypothetical protein